MPPATMGLGASAQLRLGHTLQLYPMSDPHCGPLVPSLVLGPFWMDLGHTQCWRVQLHPCLLLLLAGPDSVLAMSVLLLEPVICPQLCPLGSDPRGWHPISKGMACDGVTLTPGSAQLTEQPH